MTVATGHSEKRYFYDHKVDFPLSVLMFHPGLGENSIKLLLPWNFENTYSNE
jgi:hypothetical protein